MTTKFPISQNSDALDLIWRWNRLDLSEFDSTVQFQTDLGNASGTAVPSYVANGFFDEPVIRFTLTNLVGGVFLPVTAALATLTDPSVLIVRLRSQSLVANLLTQVGLFVNIDSGVVRGLFFSRTSNGSANQDFRAVRNDLSNTSVASNCGTGPWDAATQNIGGEEYTFEYWRQAGTAAPAFAVRLATQGYGTAADGFDAGGVARAQYAGGSDVTPDWDNVDMTRFGLAVYGSTTVATATVDFLDIALYKSSLAR